MLDRLNGADQAGEGFDLLLNPFVLLRVELEADPRKINRATRTPPKPGRQRSTFSSVPNRRY